MRGMNAQTGASVDGLAHLRQSFYDVMTTPLGSRVMRRDYGSGLFRLVDAPTHDATRVAMIAATAEAVRRWLRDRFELRAVSVTFGVGTVSITAHGVYIETGDSIDLGATL